MKKLKTMAGGVDPELLQNGTLGRAIIVDLAIGGTTVQRNNAPMERTCDFTVEVAVDDTPRYQARVHQRVPEYALAEIQPGATVVAVRVDPADPQRVAIDWATVPPTVRVASQPGATTAADILANGEAVNAVIVQSSPLGMQNHSGVDLYALVITLLPDGAPPEQIQVGNPVPPAAVPLLFPGSKVHAKVTPTNHTECAIDWDATLASPPA